MSCVGNRDVYSWPSYFRNPCLGEVLQCERDPHNVVDRYSVLCTPRFFVLPERWLLQATANVRLATEARQTTAHESLIGWLLHGRSSRSGRSGACRLQSIVKIINIWPYIDVQAARYL